MQVALNLALASLCSFLDALRNRFRRPLLTRRYDTHPYAFGLINESVCTELVFNLGDRKLSASVTGRRLSIPLLRYPIAEHLLLYGVGARPPPDGVR